VLRVRNTDCLATGTAFREVSGTLVTNRHVAGSSISIQLSTWDGTDLMATVNHVSVVSDLASVSLVPGRGLTLAQTDPPPSSPVWVAGYPEGNELQLTTGTVLDYVDGGRFGQTGQVMRSDAEIKPGNSGSPVLDASGEVIGVAFATEVDNHDTLIIPASSVARFLRQDQPLATQRYCEDG